MNREINWAGLLASVLQVGGGIALMIWGPPEAKQYAQMMIYGGAVAQQFPSVTQPKGPS